MSAPVRLLSFDTEFFGFPVASVTAVDLDAAEIDAVLDWCREERVRCLYWLAHPEATAAVHLAEERGFRLADIRLTLACAVDAVAGDVPGHEGFIVRPWREDDLPALRTLAGICHTNSRFWRDGHFPPELCRRLYEVWIEKSCQGLATAVLVAEADGVPVGYLTCLLEGGQGRISLVGVDPTRRGAGIGTGLVRCAVRWFGTRGARRLAVVTQGANVTAQRVYQQAGFRTAEVRLWFHRWFTAEER